MLSNLIVAHEENKTGKLGRVAWLVEVKLNQEGRPTQDKLDRETQPKDDTLNSKALPAKDKFDWEPRLA